MSIYQRYCTEVMDSQGNLEKFTLKYPENFNFGYDVVDVMAEETPDKTAIVWCNTENEEHIFTFSDIRKYSNQMANIWKKAGIVRGDRVMVILKRHYEYWFAAVALHKLGAVMIPATHMLTESDLVYRLKASKAKAIVCTPQDEVPNKIKSALNKCEMSAQLWCVQEDVEGFENLTAQMVESDSSFSRVDTLLGRISMFL